MKKLTTILAAVALFVSTSAFADAGVTVSEKVSAAFQSNFTEAKNVTWTKSEEFYFAHFQINNDEVAVVYNEDGDLLGTSHIISTSELPQVVAYSIKERYADYIVNPAVTQIEFEGKKSYYVTLENKTSIIRVKCTEEGVTGVEKKAKKPVLVGRVY